MLKTKSLMNKILGRFKDIETVLSASKSVAITSTSMTSYAEGAKLTLPKGVYLVIFGWAFNSSGSGARNIQAAVRRGTDASSLFGAQRTTIGYGNYASISGMDIITIPNNNTDITVVGSSDKTSTSAGTSIKAIKLGGCLKALFSRLSAVTLLKGGGRYADC